MSDHLGIHEELHRCILRKRWIGWWLKTWKPGMGKRQQKQRKKLSRRLSKWRPMWEQRQKCELGEMDQ